MKNTSKRKNKKEKTKNIMKNTGIFDEMMRKKTVQIQQSGKTLNGYEKDFRTAAAGQERQHTISLYGQHVTAEPGPLRMKAGPGMLSSGKLTQSAMKKCEDCPALRMCRNRVPARRCGCTETGSLPGAADAPKPGPCPAAGIRKAEIINSGGALQGTRRV